MRGSSTTAEYVALFRALESARGEDRLFSDRLAARLLAVRYRWLVGLARIPLVGRGVAWCIDRGWPGSRSSAVVRTRVIDDAVVSALAHGVSQLVLLGAGLDSRGWRLPGVDRARVFEVDHPETQAAKRARVATVGAAAAVTFVSVDLAGDQLAPKLSEASFAPAERSVVVWEGVTNYLDEAAVDRTLRVLAALMSEGSLLVMTYVLPGLLGGAEGSREAVRWAGRVRRVGEVFTFGSEPAAMAQRLAAHGFVVNADESTAEAALRLAEGGARREAGSTLYRVVVARRRCPA